MKPIDISGQRFGRLTVLGFSHSNSIKRYWMCRCDCGKFKTVILSQLRSGMTRSCGCLRHEGYRRTHGGASTSEYASWLSLKNRCRNSRDRNFKNYGGRGIKFCDRWLKFENFLADMGKKPSPKHSIDRYPNNDGNYEPGNCRWATAFEQACNTRRNLHIIVDGKRMSAMELAQLSGLSVITIRERIHSGKYLTLSQLTRPHHTWPKKY